MEALFKKNLGSGDLGFTGLFGGRRVPKTDRRVKLNALIDELNALLGLLRTGLRGPDRAVLLRLQELLVKTSGLVAGMRGGMKPEISELEKIIRNRSASVRPPAGFALPGSSATEALAHLARTKARICEILAWELKARGPAVFLNRLSDYLFLVAVKCSRRK